MSARRLATAGEVVGGWVCGKRLPAGGHCNRPLTYEIRFVGWEPDVLAGACAEHAAQAREGLEIESIWSVTR